MVNTLLPVSVRAAGVMAACFELKAMKSAGASSPSTLEVAVGIDADTFPEGSESHDTLVDPLAAGGVELFRLSVAMMLREEGSVYADGASAEEHDAVAFYSEVSSTTGTASAARID